MGNPILRLGTLKELSRFEDHIHSLGLNIPCDKELVRGATSPFLQPLERSGIKLGNRIAVHPMEGWDATADGGVTEPMLRRWQRLGRSGAKLVWGGEAAAVSHEGRANPHQLLVAPHTLQGIAKLRDTLVASHREITGSDQDLLVGLQLTHSGRYCRPNTQGKMEPRILYRHPVLDQRLNLSAAYPVLTDTEIEGIVENFHKAARHAQRLGFDFVDVKHCHGYLGHEFLSAHTRDGRYGGSFENRTRFLREIVEGIRTEAPGLLVGVRLSAFDMIPFLPDPAKSSPGKLGPGIPEPAESLIPYRWGFGVNPNSPTELDLAEPKQFLSLLESLKIYLVNLTAGSPYYNPHIQRPAYYPPSDGYQPPEDPLVGVARQMQTSRELKQKFPNLIFVGTAYTYLQDFLPNVAQAALRENWVDCIGLGRMVLSYPEILYDAAQGLKFENKLICRTFSDCTTAPRKGLPSGCYPLDSYYKASADAAKLKVLKSQ